MTRRLTAMMIAALLATIIERFLPLRATDLAQGGTLGSSERVTALLQRDDGRYAQKYSCARCSAESNTSG